MALTEARILECKNDEELFDLLGLELTSHFPNGEGSTREDFDAFVAKLPTLPEGLRAMAAIYQLDVSICLDDLGWHFANWHHRPYYKETLRGLRELEAYEVADIFEKAYALAQPHWDKIGELVAKDFDEFVDWYPGSELEKLTMPLTERLWEICGSSGDGHSRGLLTLWAQYARKYPHKVAMLAA
jgi:hypothetical protein